MNFVDVTNDVAFRKIFGNGNKKKALLSFLNAVISLPDKVPIVDVEITNPYQFGKLSNGRVTIVDVKATDTKGNVFIVEMQVAEAMYFEKRISYYASKDYANQIEKGEGYDKLKPVYFIGILEFEISNNPSYYSKHWVMDVETNEHIIEDVEFNFIELPKFTKPLEALETILDQWTYFIKHAENLKVIPDNVRDEGLKEAYLEANKQSWTKQELEDYDRASIRERDDKGKIEFAEKKGEQKKALDVAKRAKAKGMDMADIMELTGLAKEEIQKL